VLTTLLVLLVCLGALFYWRPLWVIDRATDATLRFAGVRSEYVQLGPYRIHYFTGGEGKPLVLVHGLGGKAENWAPLIPSLMRHGYRVDAIDLLGYGRSDHPDVDYSIALQADVLRQFLDSQHFARPDLAGWSMGGWVVLKFALDHPERVRRVVVYDSAGIYFKPAFDPALFHPQTVEQAQQFLAILTPQASRIPSFVARDLIRSTRREAWVVDRSMKSMQTGADLLDGKLQAIQAPVLIVWGKQDVLVPLSCGEEMHREMPQSTLAIYDGCGHLAPAECADRVLPETLHFLAADPPQPPSTRDFPR
jgi:pimeloyl-ACP methyl ester carboxylesterase